MSSAARSLRRPSSVDVGRVGLAWCEAISVRQVLQLDLAPRMLGSPPRIVSALSTPNCLRVFHPELSPRFPPELLSTELFSPPELLPTELFSPPPNCSSRNCFSRKTVFQPQLR